MALEEMNILNQDAAVWGGNGMSVSGPKTSEVLALEVVGNPSAR